VIAIAAGSVVDRSRRGLADLLNKCRNQVIIRKYDRRAPVGMSKTRGEAESSPPYLYTDTIARCYRTIPPMQHTAMSVNMPVVDVEIQAFKYYFEHTHTDVSVGDIIFDPEHRKFSATVDPEAEGWGKYKVLAAIPRKVDNSVVYIEVTAKRSEYVHV